MAIIKPNPIFKSISGTIGDTLTIRTVGDTTIVSAKPSKPRKRSRKPRSPLQRENNQQFKRAAYFAKYMIKIPEVYDYFKKISAGMGGPNNAYTALIRLYRNTPDLTKEKVLAIVRTAPSEETVVSEPSLAFSITGPNGDIIAQGVAVFVGKGQWKYTTPLTGVQVMITDVNGR